MHQNNGMNRNHANVIGVFAGMDSAAITVRQARCAVVRNRNARCLKCADACTSGCIHLEGGLLKVDVAKCVGCGTCATMCPTCALEAHNPSDGELFEACSRVRRGDAVHVMCRPCRQALAGLIDDAAVAEVVCLGRVEESLLVNLVAAGVRSIRLVSADCACCAQAKGEECAQIVARSARDLLRVWGNKASIEVTCAVPDALVHDGIDGEAVARALERASEGGFGNPPIKVAVADWDDGREGAERHEGERREVLRIMKDGTLPHFVPDRRERLLDGLTALGKPIGEVVASRLWGSIAIDRSKCVSCRMCATFCPTGAIARFDEESGAVGVNHFPGECVKCGTCRDICPANAITLHDEAHPSNLIDGAVERYRMRPRDVELNQPHQILETMRGKIPGQIYER